MSIKVVWITVVKTVIQSIGFWLFYLVTLYWKELKYHHANEAEDTNIGEKNCSAPVFISEGDVRVLTGTKAFVH